MVTCSLDEDILPLMLKLGLITLILKFGSSYVVSNFRPISIQSQIAKIFELLVLKDIHTAVNNIIIEE